MARMPYVESVALLKERAEIIGDALPHVTRVPRYDDHETGPSLLRANLEDVSLDALTLSGLYVLRSRLTRVSFRGADLHLSAFNWNDITECDFSDADLAGADLRASNFVRCNFSRATLVATDLRGSTFSGSIVSGADMRGTLLFRPRGILRLFGAAGGNGLAMSADQKRVIVWCDNAPEPHGG